MANFPTKATGSQLVTSNHQVLEYVPTHNSSISTTTVYHDDKNTVMLLDGDYGRDKSDYARRPTQNGSLKPYRRRGYYFGAGGGISATSSDFAFGTGDFTIEFWLKKSSTPSLKQRLFGTGTFNQSGQLTIMLSNSNGGIIIRKGTGTTQSEILSDSTNVCDDVWHHIVITRSSTSLKLFIDGVEKQSETDSTDFSQSVLEIGEDTGLDSLYSAGQYDFSGYLSDIHISKGVARYTASFDEAVTNINYSGSPKDSNHKLILRGGDDESGNSHSLTFNGNCHKTVPTTGHQASFYFDGTDDYFTFPDSTDFDLSSSSFTIEAWVNFSTVNSSYVYFLNKSHSSNGFELGIADDNKLLFYSGNGGWLDALKSNSAISANQWYHVAVTYNGSVYKMYVDGVEQSDTTTSSTYPAYSTTNLLTVGALREGSTGTDFHGYLTDVRLSKGVVRYTSGFSKPTAPLEKEDIATKFLLNPDATVHDYNVKRVNNSLFTYYGDSKSVRRGYYLNNSTEGLSTSGTFHGITVGGGSSTFSPGTGNFTIECWINPDRLNSSEYQTLLSSVNYYTSGTNGNWNLYLVGNTVAFYVADGNSVTGYMEFSSAGLVTGQWQHIALVRDGAASYKLYVNGVLKGTDTTAGLTVSQPPQEIGRNAPSSTYYAYYKGYIADIRLSENARYSGAFTELVTTKDSNHKFLALGGTSDESDCGHTFTFQNDAHPTAKFGNGSYYFDGTGDYLMTDSDIDALEFGTGDFTVECWFNRDTWEFQTDGAGLCGFDGGSWENRFAFYVDEDYDQVGASDAKKLCYFLFTVSGTTVVGARFGHSSGLGAGAWHHMAVTRESGTFKCFVDGVEQTGGNIVYFAGNATTSVNITSTMTTSGFYLGRHNGGSYYYYDGYIDDLRISNIARHTASFDVATAALPITSSSTQTTGTDSTVLALRSVAGSTFHESDRASTHDKTSIQISPSDSTDIFDSSPYNLGITLNSSPTVDVNVSVSGAAGIKFDGTDDRLLSDSSDRLTLGTDDFTIEFWVRRTGDPSDSYGALMTLNADGSNKSDLELYYHKANNYLVLWSHNEGSSGTILSTNTDLTLNTWHHIALVRSSGTTKVYQDGVETGTSSTSWTGSGPAALGLSFFKSSGAFSEHFPAYYADIRVLKVAKYTSAFTPDSRQTILDADMPSINSLSDFHAGNAVVFHAGSSEPSTPNSGSYVFYADTPDDDKTELLLHFDGDNAGTVFRDSSGNNHFLTLNGQTNTSNTKSKFGATSAYFDGTGDYLQTSAFTLDGDFTIEAWIHPTTTNSCKILTIGDVKETGAFEIFRGGGSPSLRIDTGNGSGNSLLIQGSADVSVDEWQHIAAVRSGSTLTFYKNGASIGSTTTSATFTGDLRIGAEWFNGGLSGTITGYIDELRISKAARYTTSFTPPTQPFGGGLRMKAPDGKVYALSLSGSI